LAIKGRDIFFEYDKDFLAKGINISPFKLSLEAGLQSSKDKLFADGLFGVFNDSLPDAWGRLLLDRSLGALSIKPEELSPLDRLSHIGNAHMGALSYEPFIDTDFHSDSQMVDLNKLSKKVKQVLEGSAGKVIQELLYLNGSSGGARPKILVSASSDFKTLVYDPDISNHEYEPYLVKFPSRYDPEDIAQVEYAYSLMAKAAGLEMMKTHLLHVKKDEYCFATKRFDRKGSECFHVHTLSGLLHADHNYPNLDYEAFLKVTSLLTKNRSQLLKAFRLMIFNILSHNRDDHSKNFSFLMDRHGNWSLAPAYDLTFSRGPACEHSMTVAGEGKNPSKKHIMLLAEKFNIDEAEMIYEEIRAVILDWKKFVKEAGVTKGSRESIQQVL
jgi:serine/threonine-protein kinase HipA